jgi:alcohol oxidase
MSSLSEVCIPRLRLTVGGAAGCVTAGRLAKASPTLQVMIMEAGADNRDVPNIITPALYTKNQLPGATAVHRYISKPSPHVGGRSIPIPTGAVLGGGSSVNLMAYSRASASDYNDWKMDGWSFEDLLPLFKKVRRTSSEWLIS